MELPENNIEMLMKFIPPWNLQSAIITGTIAFIGLVVLAICIRKCHRA
jgi:hypothetical protein